MRYCPHCSSELNGSTGRCVSCGESIDVETVALPEDSQAFTPTLRADSANLNKTPRTTGCAGRFVSGTVLAGRYRIVGLIGKGGMGEVYKADDLELDQVVALKFLPEQLSTNEAFLGRFRAEVRMARQVSHRNVCRVFDIGETEGLYYITMEYIDGDDLSMLLKRIGRLPADKAVEIAREICMGLAAIHRAGILHRDLKPANIIIDSRGEARITDFGIAGIESEIHGADARVGTPAYMSPEQIDGKELTPRSDIYSLGLVLYEIFTGKPAFEGSSTEELQIKHATTNPRKPSEIVTGIDPIVETVIDRCLEKNPKDRPESALRVAMSLPGGDPLQAALDAGETPSPEMVAAAPKVGSLRPSVAAALLAVVFLTFVLQTPVARYIFLYRMVPMDKPMDVLRERARGLVEKFGYSQVDSYSGFVQEPGYMDYLKNNDNSPNRWQRLMAARPAVLQFWYRSSLKPIAPLSGAQTAETDPPPVLPGMVRIRLDTRGRLVYFNGVPPRVDDTTSTIGEFDYGDLFEEAGLDAGAFQEAEPQLAPPTAFDERKAFEGKYAEDPDIPVRIEAASYRGKLVSFQLIEPWTVSRGLADAMSQVPLAIVGTALTLAVYFGILFFSILLAARNIRRGRSDIRGSLSVMVFLFAMRMGVWLFSVHHVGDQGEINNFIAGLQSALYWGFFGSVVYLAFEPYMRRFAPERVISWNRLLASDWRNPLVGRDLLVGAAAGSATIVLWELLNQLIPRWLQQRPGSPFLINAYLNGLSGFPGIFLDDLSQGLLIAFMSSFLVLFLGLMFRRKWIGSVMAWLIGVAIVLLQGIVNGQPPLEWASYLPTVTVLVVLASRFGVLSLIAFWIFINLSEIPLGTWFVGSFAAYTLTLLALAIFAFYTSTSGQKLWQGSLLGDEA